MTYKPQILSPLDGGTGVSNASTSTITIGGSLALSGAFTTTFTVSGNTSVTFPTSGTLATTAQIPSTPISLANGGTNASLVASNGGIFYSTATAGAILAGTATANQVLLSGSSTTPAWSTATYPATTTVSQILYSSATNVISGLSTANNGTLVTSATGVPSILAGPGATGKILQSNAAAAPSFSTATYPSVATGTGTILRADGTNWVASTPTFPNTAGTAGKVIISDGTNFITSTPTFPNASATSRKIIVSDGTNWVASTETYAVPGTSGNVLTSNGTNWTSATPASSSSATLSMLNNNHVSGNPVDATTYFMASSTFIAYTNNSNAQTRLYVPITGTLNICYGAITVQGTLGSNENCTLAIRLNNATDTNVTTTLQLTGASNTFSNTGLAIAVTAGDYISFKFISPTWVTNPINCCFTGTVIIS